MSSTKSRCITALLAAVFMVAFMAPTAGFCKDKAAKSPKKPHAAQGHKHEAKPRKTIKKSPYPMEYINQHSHITSAFGRRVFNHSMHNGIDFGIAKGTELSALAGGKGWTATYRGGNNGGAGNYVNLSNGKKTFQYFHLSDMSGRLEELGYKNENGTWTLHNVQKGQVIAISGNTGFSTGPHLHLQIREKDKNGKEHFVNPLKLNKKHNGAAPEFKDAPKEGGNATSDTSANVPRLTIGVASRDLDCVHCTLARIGSKPSARKLRTVSVLDGPLSHDWGNWWILQSIELKDLPKLEAGKGGSWTIKITAVTVDGKKTSHMLTIKR